ncbi:MAG: hypothetical protein ACQEQO_07335 [Thermodesulfobacteriota bacterium]
MNVSGGLGDKSPQYKLVFLLRCPALWEGSFTCAWHEADADLLAERLEVKSSAVTGRKGNADKARADSRHGPSGGSMRQNPCT